MRYDRQTMLPELGEAGQERLKNSSVLIIGVGGLGSPIALYLTAAGVGTIGLVDNDNVSLTNLQRQVLYTESELDQPKAICAQKRLKELNSEINIQAYNTRLTKENAEVLFSDYDIIVDGTDNFSTRYLINDTCIKLNKPYVYGAIGGFEGQVSVFNYMNGPTYRDLYPDETEMLEMPVFKGVLGITPAVVGSVEANEVIKLICGFGEPLSGKLWTIDLRTLETQVIYL